MGRGDLNADAFEGARVDVSEDSWPDHNKPREQPKARPPHPARVFINWLVLWGLKLVWVPALVALSFLLYSVPVTLAIWLSFRQVLVPAYGLAPLSFLQVYIISTASVVAISTVLMIYVVFKMIFPKELNPFGR